jgi:serine/threonine protein kinase/tetratricopeptide (TPR) repeat protein
MSFNPDDPTQEHHSGNDPNATASHVGASDATLTGSLVPRQIGPYKLLQRIGAGGMGEVWVAEQAEPVKRRVALKLIKEGIGSKEIIARFEAERQALALMNHPNIARILDAGTTPDGQPYFAMELVQGKPLTTYCDENRLSIDERLELLADVCSGVQHAHQKGIIHRDLKPGNILVSVIDGKAVPKVIDFGLAKAMESTQRLTDQSLFTGIGQILGTLKYMSPEQASLDSIDIDTRTDIYALGVILYELLTGSTPLDDASLQGQAALKILEYIREKEPVKPSSKLGSSTDEQISSITGRRQTDSSRLKRVLLGDLDWIVMKALEKDRTRRYESASGFAADIRRYLSNEPVIARPPSLSYRVRKFVRKNRAGVLAAALVLLTLVGGVVGTSWALFRALAAETLAEERLAQADQAREEEIKQRKLADERRLEAEQNLAFAKKGNEILGSVFTALDPKAEYARVVDLRNALRDNLQKAVEELQGAAIGDVLQVTEMQMTLGNSLLGLGLADQAITVLERAVKIRREKLGPDHPNTLTSLNNLGLAYQEAGQLDQALPLLKQTVELSTGKLGIRDPRTLTIMNNLAEGYRAAGQLDQALPLLERTLELRKAELGMDHPETLSSLNNLALGYMDIGHPDKALRLLEPALGLWKSKQGLDHPETLVSMGNLAIVYLDVGQPNKALPLLEQTVELRKAKLGLDHPETLTSLNNLATGYRAIGQLDKALPLLEQTLRLLRSTLGSEHPATLTSMNNLANFYIAARRFEQALPLLEETLELRKAKLGPEHPETLKSMNDLALGYRAFGQLDKALQLLEQA